MTNSPILQTVAQLTLYLMKLLALWIFLRGHNQPGGGFIAGLVASAAIVLQGLAFGLRQAKSVFPWPPVRLVAVGLTFAAGTTMAGLLFGYPVLTHDVWHFVLPLLGDFELPTATFFDFGVFLTVIGATKGIILAIAQDRAGVTAGPYVDVLPEPEDDEDEEEEALTTAPPPLGHGGH